MKSFIRPATTLVAVVLALSALLGASPASTTKIAATRLLAASPSTLLDVTPSQVRLLAIDPSGDIAQQQTTRRLAQSRMA